MSHFVHHTPLSQNAHHYEAMEEYYRNGYPCPDDFNFTTHIIDKWARNPNLLALHWVNSDFTQEVKLTYSELSRISHRAAVMFTETLGLKKGDAVLIQMPRMWQWWVAVFGLMRAGIVPVPGTSLLMPKDLKYRASVSKAKVFIGDHTACSRVEEIIHETGISRVIQIDKTVAHPTRLSLLELIEKIPENIKYTPPEETSKEDTVIYYFTSGTTGDPKMVWHTAEYTLGLRFAGHWYRINPGTVFYNLADVGWAKTAYSTFGTLNLGGTMFVNLPKPGTFDPRDILDLLHKYPINVFCLPPTVYRALVSRENQRYYKEHPPLAVEHCVSGGEPLNGSVIGEWRSLTQITINECWGQTETSVLVGNFAGMEVKPGSMGKATPGHYIAVLDADANELGPGEEGELSVRLDVGIGENYILKGYIKKDGTFDARRKTNAKTGRVYFPTGDRGTYDKDGYFWFVGRTDDVITSSGYRIGPFEVESALKEHPCVLESAAVASPDIQKNEIVKAFIALSDEYKHVYHQTEEEQQKLKEDIITFFKTRTAPYKVPREIEFLEALPKTISGKIRRVDLRNAEYAKKKHIADQIIADRKAKL